MFDVHYRSAERDFTLLQGDCFELLPQFNFKFDMVFADPPYFLSNNGISYQAGKIVSVNKGEWDRGKTPEEMNEYNMRWISVANSLNELGFKILNVVTWAKTNPPPNISCRYFTYSTEFIIWARKSTKSPHYFNYELMKHLNGDKQMTDVWRLPAIAPWEKSCGKHPTQKPLALLTRIILASTQKNAWILDPFAGSSTTGIAANLICRRYLGIEQEIEFAEMGRKRREEIENNKVYNDYRSRIKDIAKAEIIEPTLSVCEEEQVWDLPF